MSTGPGGPAHRTSYGNKQTKQEVEEEGFPELAAKFRGVGLIEKRREERYRALLQNIRNDEVFQKSEIKMWECRYCGHICIGTRAPKVCPICGAAQASFAINKVNY